MHADVERPYATFVTFVIFVANVFVGVVAGLNAQPFPTPNGD
jgi:hypothetical protein